MTRIEALVNRARSGDIVACKTLYAMTQKSVYYLVSSIIEDKSSVEEIVRYAYKKAFSSLEALKKSAGFGIWVQQLAALKCIDYLRRRNQLVFSSAPNPVGAPIDENTEFLPEGIDKSPDAIKAINKIIGALPNTHRILLMLRYYMRFPVPRISKMLGCTEDVVSNELVSVRVNIKFYIDRMLKKETAVYPANGELLVSKILNNAKNHADIDEYTAERIFASATEGIFSGASEPVFAQPAPAYQPRSTVNREPEKPAKAPKGGNNKKQIAIIAAAVVLVVTVAGIFIIPKLLPQKDETGETAAAVTTEESGYFTESVQSVGSVIIGNPGMTENTTDVTLTTQTVTDDTGFLEASKADWNAFLKEFDILTAYTGEYDNKTSDAYEVVLHSYGCDLIFEYYFDSGMEIFDDGDPLGRIGSYYCAVDGEKVDWIISEVLNGKTNHSLNKKDKYYHNGKYYASPADGSCPVKEVDDISYEKQADGKYKVKLRLIGYIGESYGEEDAVGYASEWEIVAALKEDGNRKFWSFYSIKVTASESPYAESEAVPEWEANYLEALEEFSDTFGFILTDLDKNDIPDMILVMHRGTRGAITYIFMNGDTSDLEDGADYSEDEFYFSKDGKIATLSYFYFREDPKPDMPYLFYEECFSYVELNEKGFDNYDSVYRETEYTDSSHEEVVNVRYFVHDEDYNEVEISESEFNEVYNDITQNYTKATETSVEDFRASGKSLSSYYVKYY